jgi:hypothetical protein
MAKGHSDALMCRPEAVCRLPIREFESPRRDQGVDQIVGDLNPRHGQQQTRPVEDLPRRHLCHTADPRRENLWAPCQTVHTLAIWRRARSNHPPT